MMQRHLAGRTTAGRQTEEPLVAPRLLGSSDALGWEEFTVRTFDEPAAMEHWRAPDSPALSLVLVTRGVMHVEQRRLDGPWEAATLAAGDAFLRPSGREPYELRWWAGSPELMRTLHLHVQPGLVRQSCAALHRGDAARHEVIEQVGLRDPLLAQIGGRLASILAHATPADRIDAETIVQLALAQILRHHTARGTPAERPHRLSPQQRQRVADYVAANLDRPITLEDLAAQAGYSSYHFARLFREATGESPYQFVLRQRVGAAEQLLRTARLPLLDIALACGFASQSHMTRLFRQHVGVTPGAYQRLLGAPQPPTVERSQPR